MQPQPILSSTATYSTQLGYPQDIVYTQQPGDPQTALLLQPITNGNVNNVHSSSSAALIPVPVVKSIFSKPQTSEEKTAFLSQYDFMVIVDKSGSMKFENRWTQLQEYIGFIADEAATYDQNGLDLCFYDDVTHWKKNVESCSKVVDLFKHYHPSDGTDTAKALEEAFHKHFHRKKEKAQNQQMQKTIILVFTDGQPNSQEDVIKKIVNACKKLDPSFMFDYPTKNGKTIKKSLELGIRFFQIGHDEKATHFLKQLDDHLGKTMKHNHLTKIDIVDTGNLDEVTDKNNIADAFVNAIFD